MTKQNLLVTKALRETILTHVLKQNNKWLKFVRQGEITPLHPFVEGIPF